MEAAFADFRTVWLSDPLSPFDPGQQSETLQRMLDFLHSSPEVFERRHLVGHFTGSAMIVDPTLERVALTLHKKLGKWLQFGGHADGDTKLDEVGLKEGLEESGLIQLDFLPYEPLLGRPGLRRVPFDLDIHEIPPWKDVPTHLHYDVIYLLMSKNPEELQASDESDEVGWFPLARARELCQEQNMLRQFRKIDLIRSLM